MKLYGYWRSSSSWRVRIALAHKGLDYEYAAVHLRDGAQRADWYADLNAAKQVPLLELEIDGQTRRVGQSMAILALLEQLHPDPAFLPSDPYLRARSVQLAELVNSGIQPLQNLSVILKLKAMDQDAKSWCQEAIANGLAAYEATMSDVAGDFSVGDAPSWADACLIPQLYNARRFSLDLTPYPTIARVEANCFELPAFESSRPELMPDNES